MIVLGKFDPAEICVDASAELCIEAGAVELDSVGSSEGTESTETVSFVSVILPSFSTLELGAVVNSVISESKAVSKVDRSLSEFSKIGSV